MLELVLNTNRPLAANWHLAYGMTETRHRTLLAPLPERNSFLHAGSETALSLFMFGNMDCWKQCGMTNGPRSEKGQWNDSLFGSLRQNATTSCSQQPLWSRLNHGVFADESLNWQGSVLMFEFEVMNSKFHSIYGRTFKELSFLDIKVNKKWGAFDAFIVVPAAHPTPERRGVLIGFEAKLDNDISRHTEGFPFVNQVMRNLEAGYWLTHHEASLYQNWDFHYVFACPRHEFELGAMLYSWMLRDRVARDQAVSHYRLVLAHHDTSVNDDHFESFRQMVLDRVSVVFWDQLATVLSQERTSFWNDHFNRLQQELLSKEVVGASLSRLKSAGIAVL